MKCLSRLGLIVLLAALISSSLPLVGAAYSQPPIPCSNEFILGQPTAPTLLDPANGTVYAQTWPSFSWSAVEGATSYTLEIAGSSSFDDQFLLIYSGLNVTEFNPEVNQTMQDLQAWYWRVRAGNESGYGPYSDTRTILFSVVFPPVGGQFAPIAGAFGIAAIAVVVIATYRLYGRKRMSDGTPEERQMRDPYVPHIV